MLNGVLLAVALMGVACTQVNPFACGDDSECGSGVCVGFCATTAAACPSGLQYGDSAGSLSGLCVEMDAGAPDAPSPDARVPRRTLYVDATGGSDFDDGSEGSPFESLTKALSVAELDDFVLARPGLYDVDNGEIFPITVPTRVVLIGDPDNKGAGEIATEIVGDGAVPDTDNNVAALVLSEGSYVSGFQFRVGSGLVTSGVFLADVTAEVRENTFAEGYAGVVVEGAGSSLVRGNVTYTQSYGAYYRITEGSPILENNEILGNGAIDVSRVGTGQVLIRGNTVVGSGVGIISAVGNHRIEGNTISRPGGYTHGCIYVWDDQVVRDNLCTVDAGYAIKIYSGANPNLGTLADPGGNEFMGASGLAILHNGSSTVTAVGNRWFGALIPDCMTQVSLTGGGKIEYFPSTGICE